MTLTPTNVRVQDLDLQIAPITARLEAGHVTTDGLVVTSAGSSFRVDGDADLRARTFQATGKGVLELRTLSPLLQEASLTGLADWTSPRADRSRTRRREARSACAKARSAHATSASP